MRYFPSIHRMEQWDLGCWPWVCIHWHYPNGARRVFCLWPGGVQVGEWYWLRADTQHKGADDER